nr:hypothetical protein CFP56_78039 [Quercus suber]
MHSSACDLQLAIDSISSNFHICHRSPEPDALASEIEELFRPRDPRVAEAKDRCRAGDDSVLPILEKLAQGATSPQTLQICLSEAVASGNEAIDHKLLSLGVSVDITSIRYAVAHKAVNLLSLFMRYDWDISKDIACCSPPPLSWVGSQSHGKSLRVLTLMNRLALVPEVEIDKRVISWFLANGANPDAVCGIDITPLSYAVQHAPLHIVQMLLKSTGPVRNGQLLHHAAWRTDDDCGQVCRYILDRCDFDINEILYQNHAMSFACSKSQVSAYLYMRQPGLVGRRVCLSYLITYSCPGRDDMGDDQYLRYNVGSWMDCTAIATGLVPYAKAYKSRDSHSSAIGLQGLHSGDKCYRIMHMTAQFH